MPRLFHVGLLLAAFLACGVVRPAWAEYRTPLVFPPQQFALIRPALITPQPFRPVFIPRENLRPAPIAPIRQTFTPIRSAPVRKDAFRFSSTIFGYVDEGPARGPGTSYVPEALRKTTRRRPLGW